MPIANRVRVIAVMTVLLLAGRLAWAADDKAGKPAEPLPLTKVVLFNAGVGFFQHDGQIDGDKKIELQFNVDDINDLLKSMVVEAGKISNVTYGSKDPITKTLSTFAIDLTSNPSLADLLAQIRGEKIEIESPQKMTGTIIGVETRKEHLDKTDTTIDRTFINLLTDTGLRSVPLASVSRIKLVNEKLDSELRQALAVLAMGHSTDKKSVVLDFPGKGKRSVRVGYIQQAPIWKTSYRLVLSDSDQPYLQGWAIVENTTEHDWSDVSLTLVSGRPISFVMNLYDPLYINRPTVEPELFASLRPQTYGQNLAEKQKWEQLTMSRAIRKAAPAAAPPPTAGAAQFGMAQVPALVTREVDSAPTDESTLSRLNLEQNALATAQGANVGELFQYAIESPVTLARHQSAMLPIVQESVKGEKVSIYNGRVQVDHPLNGLRLTNSTKLHLQQGPITVFDDGVYAGDARIEDLPPGAERLLSYALDLDTEVASHSTARPNELTSAKIVKGLLETSQKYERTVEYTVKNSGGKSKQVLIEYPRSADWKLVQPAKPAEKTRDLYRFAVTAKPDAPAKLLVAEEQLIRQQIGLTNLNETTIQFYVSSKAVSEPVKAALGELVQKKRDLQSLQQRNMELQARITAISQEQGRIRENMQQLDRTSDLYMRYVKKLNEQEDEIEKDRTQADDLQQQINKAQTALDDYLANLNVG
ncbi:MAG TPA: hypothetical protein VHV55_19920 [Pirellulales bacterium]|jgi:hypothetical protein|nr:hypothetical protein [Pirellulales bacterium]